MITVNIILIALGVCASTLEGSVFGLMGLLIAFTFSSAASRYDTRRSLVVDEANAIGTAWLRLDLLPADKQAGLRETSGHTWIAGSRSIKT